VNKPGLQTTIPGTAKRGRARQYKDNAARTRAYRKRQKANANTAEIRCTVSSEARERLRRMAKELGMAEKDVLEGIIIAADERVLVMSTVEDSGIYSV